MKKIIIPIAIILVIMGVIIWKNFVVSKIFLEINPSIEIRLDRNNKVTKVVPLNDDAKAITKGKFFGKDIDTVMAILTENIIKNDYSEGEDTAILMYSEGKVDKDKLINNIYKMFEERQQHVTVTVIEEVTEEDKKIAKKYDISLVRAAYINQIIAEYENINIDDLVNKQIRELRETKDTGKYCDKDYTLEGDFCVKKTGEQAAETGKVCPEGYMEYEDKCYAKTEGIETDEYGCPDGFTLTSDNKCVGKEKAEPTPNFTCETGEPIQRGMVGNREIRNAGHWKEYLCEDKSNAKYPTERCYNQEHAIINGKCAMGPKPLLPTPTGCEGDDINYNGGCYDPTPDEPYICPDGFRYDTNTEPCPDTFTYTKASGSYTCPSGYTLNDYDCEKEVSRLATHKKTCPSGYTVVNFDQCINKEQTTDFVDGYICQERDTRLEGNACIIYETVEAKHN